MSLCGEIITETGQHLIWGEDDNDLFQNDKNKFSIRYSSENFSAVPKFIRKDYLYLIEHLDIQAGQAHTILFDFNTIWQIICNLLGKDFPKFNPDCASIESFQDYAQQIANIKILCDDLYVVLEAIRQFGKVRISWSW